MQTIEQACLLGNLQEIDKILNQSAPIDKIDDFISAISCCIEYQNLKVFNHLLQKKGFQDTIINQQTRIKTFIIQNDSTKFMQAFNHVLNQLGASNSFFGQQIELPLQEFETVLLPLDADEKQAIADLTQYYQTILSNHPLEYHLQQLKNYLAKQYQDNPATFQNTTLPLHWEALGVLATEENYPPILKSYYQHTIHTAWRYLQSVNPWRSQENDVFFKQNQKDNQWFIILIWYAAHDTNFSKQDSIHHLQNFIQTLAAFNRSGNTDDVSGDKPLPSKDIRRILLKALNQHPLAIILDDTKIEKEEKAFIERKWQEIFSTLSIEQFLQVKYHWEKIHQNPRHSEHQNKLEKFNLSELQIEEFQKLMDTKWGSRWKKNNHLLVNSKQRLQSNSLLCIQLKKLFDDLIKQYGSTHHNPSISLQFFKTPSRIDQELVSIAIDNDLIFK